MPKYIVHLVKHITVELEAATQDEALEKARTEANSNNPNPDWVVEEWEGPFDSAE